MSEINRRDFVAAAAVTVCGCMLAGEAFADAPKAADTPKASAPTAIDVGTKADYPKDGVTDKWAKSQRILVVRNEGKIYAPTATCTHKNCALKNKGGDIACGCHGSKYTLMGVPIKGPAKFPLHRYGISIDDKGHLIIDKSKQFEEKHWDDAGASVSAT
jgi:Rieske Fe-S protein